MNSKLDHILATHLIFWILIIGLFRWWMTTQGSPLHPENGLLRAISIVFLISIILAVPTALAELIIRDIRHRMQRND